jgi:hypothetical protein
MLDPLDHIRSSILKAAESGADPRKVAALLLKVSSEVCITTHSMSREEWQDLASGLWERSETEHTMRRRVLES